MTDTPHAHVDEAVAKVRDLIKGERITMLTTVSADGRLTARPMANQQTEFDGDVWLIADASSAKVAEITADPRVNLAFAGKSYVSLSGTAEIVRDPAKNAELWNPFVAAWFESGPDDPAVVLIKVCPDSAEYWETASAPVQVVKMLTAAVTKKQPDVGENETVTFD